MDRRRRPQCEREDQRSSLDASTLGDLDLLGEVTGAGGYEDLLPHARPLELYGTKYLCFDLDTLIRIKRAAGQAKDLEAIAELEALLEERDPRGGG